MCLGYAHLADIILLNNSRGLGDVSESCLGMYQVFEFDIEILDLVFPKIVICST